MKKVFFAFVAASVVVLSACNNKPADPATTTPDTTVVAPMVEETAPVATDTTAVSDTTVAK